MNFAQITSYNKNMGLNILIKRGSVIVFSRLILNLTNYCSDCMKFDSNVHSPQMMIVNILGDSLFVLGCNE